MHVGKQLIQQLHTFLALHELYGRGQVSFSLRRQLARCMDNQLTSAIRVPVYVQTRSPRETVSLRLLGIRGSINANR